MIVRGFLAMIGALALAGCDRAPPSIADGEPGPALWEVRSAGGVVEGWLFGTVHALPEGTAWRTTRLDTVVARADLLVVEAADLDSEGLSRIFAGLAFDKPQGPVRSRISPALRDEFDTIANEAAGRLGNLDRMETWAAALAVAQTAQGGELENGADRALLAQFRGRRIEELEGARRQLAIFDSLPEKEQRDLIDAVIVEIAQGKAGDDRLTQDWLRGDVEALGLKTGEGMLADPELREALLVGRNRAWTEALVDLFDEDAQPLVAVGAGHLAGPESIAVMLEQRGYSVRRVE